jgi:hypothetical protein|nr:MAG TPA: hypothetical protein [Caudoviricetes sp.]
MKKQTFEKGDRVFDYLKGWGEIVHLYSDNWEEVDDNYIVCVVKFDSGEELEYFTKYLATKMLSFTEYTLQGFTQEKPVNYKDYVRKWGKFWDVTKHSGIQNMVIGHLSVYNEKDVDGFPFACEETGVYYTNFEPLTEEQIKVLELCN